MADKPRKQDFATAAAEHTEKQRCAFLRMPKHPNHPDKKKAHAEFHTKFKEFKRKYDDQNK